MLGKISSLPLADSFAAKMSINSTYDAIKAADNLRKDFAFRKEKFPAKYLNPVILLLFI